MDLELSRIDYAISGISLPNTMELLPAVGPRLTQRVVIGDQDGVLQSFSMKKGEQQMVFKTLPGAPISRVCLGGAHGTTKDKIFVSKKGDVHGYTKKGKLFLSFDTCFAESIKSMNVNGSTLLLCGNTVYNQFRDCEDTGSFLCSDVINDVVSLPGEKTRSLVPVLACADGTVRVLDGADLEAQCRQSRSQAHSARGQPKYEVRVPSAPTVLHLAANNGGESGQNVLFGTADGRVGVLTVTRNSEPTWRWLVEEERPGAAVSSLHCHDLTGDGELDLILGRDDGSLEVHATSGVPEHLGDDPVARRYSYTCPESVSSARGGVLGTNGYDEVVVSTYTGLLFGLTTERVDGVAALDSSNVSMSQDARRKMTALRAELDALEEKVMVERDKYLQAAESGVDALSVVPYLNINYKLSLLKDEAAYLLTLEAATAIDNVLVQADVPVDVLDVDRNSAVVSFSDCDPEGANRALVTFRCQLNTTRLDLRLRTVEGKAGRLRVYVTPLVAPKCAALRVLKIAPLSLHVRVHRADDGHAGHAGPAGRPYSVLTLRGPFSLAEVHAWLTDCLPELSDKPPSETCTLYFQSTFMGTMLVCSYGKGEAEFKSDNVSTISILKDCLSKAATSRSIHLDISCVVSPESGPHSVRLMFPLLLEQAALRRDLGLLDALRDLDRDALAPKFLAILDNENELRERHKRHPTYLDRLCGMLTDLYIDHFKFRGGNFKSRVPQLLETVYQAPLDTLLDSLLQFFSDP